MLRVAVINLNKRLSRQEPRAALSQWVRRRGVDILVGLEPWRVGKQKDWTIDRLQAVGGTDKVFVWAREDLRIGRIRALGDFSARIELGYLVLYGVYLDAYARAQRARQLAELTSAVQREGSRPLVVAGDFNIAPQPADGLFRGRPSSFNSPIDRQPLAALLATARLVDLGQASGRREWTIEKMMRGGRSQFRCDLVLASDYLCPEIRLQYDHGIRRGQMRWTDHSALLLRLPITLAGSAASERRMATQKTAMHRRRPSAVAVKVVRPLLEQRPHASILDYGCGYGNDVRYYRSLGFRAVGFDPHPQFGFAKRPSSMYQVVSLVFVLNVLPNPWERLRALAAAAKHVATGGVLVVAARSPEEIRSQAQRGCWQKFNDGHCSHEGKQTFQGGISPAEVRRYARRIGFHESRVAATVSAIDRATVVVLERDARP